MYWMSRYMERSDIHLRVLNAVYISDQDGLIPVDWKQIALHFSLKSPEVASGIDVLTQLIFDVNMEFSILNNVFRARENARSAQDHINRELWQCLNDFYHLIKDEQLRVAMPVDPISVMDQLIKQTMLYEGIIHNSMNRGEAFCFLKLGKFAERGFQIVDLLNYQLRKDLAPQQEKPDEQQWRYLLIALNGYETYLREHVGNLDPDLVFEQIVNKGNFPHSLHYSWEQISSFLKLMKKASVGLQHPELSFVVGKAFAYIKYTALPDSREGRLHYLQVLLQHYEDLHRILNNDYFGNIY